MKKYSTGYTTKKHGSLRAKKKGKPGQRSRLALTLARLRNRE